MLEQAHHEDMVTHHRDKDNLRDPHLTNMYQCQRLLGKTGTVHLSTDQVSNRPRPLSNKRVVGDLTGWVGWPRITALFHSIIRLFNPGQRSEIKTNWIFVSRT